MGPGGVEASDGSGDRHLGQPRAKAFFCLLPLCSLGSNSQVGQRSVCHDGETCRMVRLQSDESPMWLGWKGMGRGRELREQHIVLPFR